MPDKMPQAEFLAGLREQIPEFKDYSDMQIMEKIFEGRPDLREVIETPDEQAERAQFKASLAGQRAVDPEFWNAHPTMARIARAGTGMLPAVGGIIGGSTSIPAAFTGAPIVGGALGLGAGKGAEDLLNQELGLDYTDPMQKGANIAKTTGLGLVTGAGMEALRQPISTAKILAGDLAKFGRNLPLGRYLTPTFLKEFSESKPPVNPFERPPWQTWQKPPSETVETPLTKTSPTKFEPGAPVKSEPIPNKINVEPKPPSPNAQPTFKPSATSFQPGAPIKTEPIPNKINVEAPKEQAMRIVRGPNGRFIKVPDEGPEINAIIDKYLKKKKD